MGNAGSAFLGYSIAWIVFRLTQNEGHPVNPVLALWLIPIPVLDCLVLIVRRMRQGRSPFSADRNHVHHLMRDAGFSSAQLAVAPASFSLLTGLLAGQAMRMDVPNPLLLALFGLAMVAWCLLTLRRERVCAIFAGLHRTVFAMRGRGTLPAGSAQATRRKSVAPAAGAGNTGRAHAGRSTNSATMPGHAPVAQPDRVVASKAATRPP
ncbi:hypothetical protein H1235_00555 [Pseudoxanthomonas sp. NC8]|nr:hypothetical protein H1235_00555 [Pseudoxanthomonas sp. NC8]